MAEVKPRRIVQITEIDDLGRRVPVIVTADEYVVRATERAIEERVHAELGPLTAGGRPEREQ